MSDITHQTYWEKRTERKRNPHPESTQLYTHTHKFHYFPFLGRPLLLTLKFIASFFSSRTSPPCARLAVMLVDECKFQSFRFNVQEKKPPSPLHVCMMKASLRCSVRGRSPKLILLERLRKKAGILFFLLLFFPDDVGCNKYASTLVQMKLVWRISHTRVGHSRRLNRWRGRLTTWAKTDMSSPTPAAAASLMVCRHRHWCCCCCTSNLQYFNHYSSFFFLSSFFLSLCYICSISF